MWLNGKQCAGDEHVRCWERAGLGFVWCVSVNHWHRLKETCDIRSQCEGSYHVQSFKRPMEAGTSEFSRRVVLHLGRMCQRPDGSNMKSLDRGWPGSVVFK